MKKGKIILDKNLSKINFNDYPTLTVEVKTNEDGSKVFNGKMKWIPLKIELIQKEENQIENGNYDCIFLTEDDSPRTYKLSNCKVNFENSELEFEECKLFE